MAISIAEVIEKLSQKEVSPEDIGKILEAARKAAIEGRRKLSKVVRDFWNSDEGQLVKMMLEWEAEQSGFAAEMERIMSGVKDEIKKVAKAVGLSSRYRMVWGKPPKKE